MSHEPDENAAPWKHALRAFIASGMTYGDTVPHAWFWEAFGLEMPTHRTLATDADRRRMRFLKQFEQLRSKLLTDHKIDLRNEFAVGYLIVKPGDQTKLAYDDGMDAIGREFRNMTRRIVNVNHNELTQEQRQENNETQAHVEGLRVAMRRRRRPRMLDG